MAGTRASKRAAGIPAEEELPAKRPAKHPAPLKQISNAKKPPSRLAQRSYHKGYSKGKQPELDTTPCPVTLPIDAPLSAITSTAPPSSLLSNSTSLPNTTKDKAPSQFNLTQKQTAYL
jgi:hypothetical protein